MKFNTYQNKKLKAIQIMALKAWLEEDGDNWKFWIEKRDKFEQNADRKEYEIKYKNKPEHYNVMP